MEVKKYYSKIIASAVVAIAAISIFIGYNNFTTYYKYSLSNALDYYGFASSNQKHAIQNLFQRSSIIPANKTLDQAFPVRQTKEAIMPDIMTVLKETQKKFVVRRGIQERWEVQSLEWMDQNKEEILLDLKVLGLVDPIEPKQKTIDAFCILGGTAPRMADRIEYVNSLIQVGLKTKAIILLAGERYVTKDIDGTEEQLIQIANKFNLQDWTKLTETHLIHNLYNKSALYNKDITAHIIDTPKRDLPRPTTQTTILELIEWLKSHQEIQNIIFVSNQPYVKYQKAIIDIIFKEQHVNIKYEVIGSAVKNPENLQPILEGMGSYLWAATPAVLQEMNVQITDEAIRGTLKELYSKNPLIYKTIPHTFTK